jgi:hypothetical protein
MKACTRTHHRRLAVVGLLLCLTCGLAHAAGPWDGLWDLDPGRSRPAAQSFVLVKLANGMWKYGDGASASVFAMDGRPYPEQNASDFAMSATLSGTDTLVLVESAHGREIERDRWTLSADGRTLTVTATRIYPDGREATSATEALRTTGDSGFAGTWKEARGDDSSTSSSSSAPEDPSSGLGHPSRPYWVISTSSDGVMSWFIPATGELLRGRTDGRSRPITGPQQPARRTFVWKQVSPHRIEFYASDNGHLIARATETLSPDGKTFTDALWAPGHEDEKDLRVFVKR